MSALAIYRIDAEGVVRFQDRAANSWGGAHFIWTRLAAKYLGSLYAVYAEDLRPLWRLLIDPRLTEDEALAMAFSYDRVWVKRENLPRLAAALRTFYANFGEGTVRTLCEAADILDKIHAESTNVGACFNQTTVNSNPWRVQEPTPEEEDPVDHQRPFNFQRDTEIDGRPVWELFDRTAWAREANN